MPNFWTNATQMLYEKFKGPRTKDLEFEAKYEQIKGFERHSNGLKSLFYNFTKNTLGMKNYFKDITTLIPPLYENTSPYTPHILEMTKFHNEIEKYFDEMCNEVNNMGSVMDDWNKFYEDINNLYRQRENLRKIYDHYDEKLEKFIKIRDEKAFKKITESQNEIEKFDRNDEKYRQSTKDFVSISIFTYRKMNEFLDMTYNLINPIILKLLDQERKFFNFCYDTMKKMENLKSRFQTIENSYKRPTDNYNPLKYIRGSKLMDETFINNNFPELDFSKDLKEWKDKEKSGKKGVLSYEEYLKKAKEERMNSNNTKDIPSYSAQNIIKNSSETKNSGKFTYEDYKKKLSMNSNTNNQSTTQDFSNRNTFGNNKNANFEMDFNQISNNFSNNGNNNFDVSKNNNVAPLNFDLNDAPKTDNPYENIGIDNINFNSNNMNFNYNNMNYGYGGFGNTNPGLNNMNNNISNYPNNMNFNKNQQVNNNDFFNINNLNFPK